MAVTGLAGAGGRRRRWIGIARTKRFSSRHFGLVMKKGVALTRILHKGLEQAGGSGVSKLENTDAYANTLRRPPPDRL